MKISTIPSELNAWLKDFNILKQQLEKKGFTPTADHARSSLENLTRHFVEELEDFPETIDTYVDAEQHKIPLRIYNPAANQKLPVLLYVHGGGHMSGSVDVYDTITKKIAIATHHIVVSIDYRLAPEHPYPCGLEDVITSIEHVFDLLRSHDINFSEHLSIAGDSAGGALCASAAHHFQIHTDVVIQKQILIYPSLDYTLSTDSVKTLAKGYLLESDRIQWYFDHYFLPDTDAQKASPLFMSCSDNMPDTLLIAAEFCPLRDEAEAYASKLSQNDIEVKHVLMDGMLHAFLNLESITQDACDETYQIMADFLN